MDGRYCKKRAVVFVFDSIFLNVVCISGAGNMKLHCCVAAYVSDYAFLGTALLPYPNHRAQFSASLDHAMWFHSTFRADEWMLYECESPWSGQFIRNEPHDSIPGVCVSFEISHKNTLD